MKTKIMFLVVLLLLSVGLVSAKIQIPAPVGYVNDFAQQLTSQQVADLDKKLRDYDKQTTIQFVIVIVPSLQGQDAFTFSKEVGRQWQVGNKGIDGYLLLWAPTERKYFLQVGLHQEAYLGDGEAGQILRDHLVQNLKDNKGFQGLNETVDAVIAYVGADSPARREELRQQKLEVEKIKAQQSRAYWNTVFETILWVIFFAGILIAMAYGIRKIVIKLKEMIRKSRLRKQLEQEIADFQSALKASQKESREVYISSLGKLKTQSYLDNLELLHKLIHDGQHDILFKLAAAEDLIDSDPDETQELLLQIDPLNFTRIEDAVQSMKDLVSDFAKVAKEAPEKVEYNKQKCQTARKLLESRANRGYKIDVNKELSPATALLVEAETCLTENSYDPVTAIKKSTQAFNFATDRLKYFTGLQSLQAVTDVRIGKLTKQLGGRPDSKQQYIDAKTQLDILKFYPQSVWKDVNAKISSFDLGEWLDNLSAKVKQAMGLNSMMSQQYGQAAKLVDEVENNLAETNKLFGEPKEILGKLASAQRDCSSLYDQLDENITQATNALDHPDVGLEASRLLAKASIQFKSLKKVSMSEKYQDWISILASLQTVSGLIQQSLNLAQSDKSAAEAARKRKKREAEEAADAERRRKKQEQDDEEERQRRNRNASIYSDSSNFGSDSSSGGFSGGGGDFGGGGAGGSY